MPLLPRTTIACSPCASSKPPSVTVGVVAVLLAARPKLPPGHAIQSAANANRQWHNPRFCPQVLQRNVQHAGAGARNQHRAAVHADGLIHARPFHTIRMPRIVLRDDRLPEDADAEREVGTDIGRRPQPGDGKDIAIRDAACGLAVGNARNAPLPQCCERRPRQTGPRMRPLARRRPQQPSERSPTNAAKDRIVVRETMA